MTNGKIHKSNDRPAKPAVAKTTQTDSKAKDHRVLFDKKLLSIGWRSNRRIGPGLVNVGNTCFLNSTLQCLTYTPTFAEYLLDRLHSKSCKMKDFCAMCALQDHVQRCLLGDKSGGGGGVISPRNITGKLRAISSHMRLGRQEDSHEFLRHLMQAAQKSCLAGLGKLPHSVQETTAVHQIFGGYLRSQVRCLKCKAESNTYDPCLDLSVDINTSNTLHRALRDFIKVDHIGGRDNKYKCSACHSLVDAEKQMTVHRAPIALTVHLKRFTYNWRRGGMDKVSKHIEFPERLDISPFMSQTTRKTARPYELYGVLVHMGGGCHSGHYYAYVKNANGKWYCMDDDDVRPVSIQTVMRERAYMLFYTQEAGVEINAAIKKRTAHEAGINGNNAAHEQRLKQAKSEVMPEPTKPAAPMQIPKVSVTLAVEPPATAPVASLAEQPESANILNGVGGLWVVRSIYVPRKSLRGNVSPATISSALSHTNRWTVRPLNEATPPPVNRLLQRNSSNLSVSSMGSTNSSPSASDEETAKRKPMRVSQWQVRS
ncbi:Ubiquitin carboxyl-terminal hydrolase 36 [Umbelopsis sp. WA50703]